MDSIVETPYCAFESIRLHHRGVKFDCTGSSAVKRPRRFGVWAYRYPDTRTWDWFIDSRLPPPFHSRVKYLKVVRSHSLGYYWKMEISPTCYKPT